jgi:hypothetical protein
VCTTITLLTGCIADGKSRQFDQRVTYVAKEQATPAYYLAKPPAAKASASDFDAVWASLTRVTRDAGFLPDLEDHRLGLFTTLPLVSAQPFEPWRGDVGSIYGRAESALATVRRTVRWEVTRNDDGTFAAAPRVLVERFTIIEHRITSSAQYTEVFALTPEEQRNQQLRALDPAAALTEPIPTAYWYAIGRDEALEKQLASSVQGRVAKS